jgi:hypothetical protein
MEVPVFHSTRTISLLVMINLALLPMASTAGEHVGIEPQPSGAQVSAKAAVKVGLASASYSVAEGDGAATVSVQLSKSANKTVTVQYASAAGSATPGSDYLETSGTLSFDPGVTEQSFAVTIVDDADGEADETVSLTLSNPTNAGLGLDSAVLTILDNDGGPPQLPVAAFTAPTDGATYTTGQQVAMDGSGSTVPSGFLVWFAALEGGGDPMTAAHIGSTLQESFTAGPVDSYVIRLVIASAAAMPDDTALRSSALPCSGETECDASQVVINRELPPGLHGFELAYAFPEVAFVRWDSPADPTVERSDDGGQTWLPVTGSEPFGSYHLRDDTVVAGTTSHYRMQGAGETDWTYLGSTSEAPVWQLTCRCGPHLGLCPTCHPRHRASPGTSRRGPARSRRPAPWTCCSNPSPDSRWPAAPYASTSMRRPYRYSMAPVAILT